MTTDLCPVCENSGYSIGTQAECERCELRRELELVRGAMAAQDRREAVAGAKCGVPYELSACDWPDDVAEVVLTLRARVRELEAKDDTPQPTRAR